MKPNKIVTIDSEIFTFTKHGRNYSRIRQSDPHVVTLTIDFLGGGKIFVILCIVRNKTFRTKKNINQPSASFEMFVQVSRFQNVTV